VLGARLTLEGWMAAGVLLLAVGALAWAFLQGPIWRHFRTPTVGASFLRPVWRPGLGLRDALARHRGGHHDQDRARPSAVQPHLVELHLPVGTCVTGTSELALQTGADALTWAAVALYAVLLGGWVLAALNTARGSLAGELFLAPEQQQAKASRDRHRRERPLLPATPSIREVTP
jgi:hypothetical protein